MGKINVDQQVVSKLLIDSVRETFDSMCKENFTKDPVFTKQDVELVNDRVEISGFGKFAAKCFLSTIYFYPSTAAIKTNKSCGGMVIYIKDSGILKLINKMDQGDIDARDEDVINDLCGEFCNVIAGAFRQKLAVQGFDLQMGVPNNVRDILNGGFFVHKKQKFFYELNVFLFDSNPVVIDLFI